MQWLLTSHVRRHHRTHRSSGHIWQGRYKSFLVKDDDEHLLTVLRYIEGHPVRSGVVAAACDWSWSSHRERVAGKLPELPNTLPLDWATRVDRLLSAEELERLGQSVRRQTPFGRWEMAD